MRQRLRPSGDIVRLMNKALEAMILDGLGRKIQCSCYEIVMKVTYRRFNCYLKWFQSAVDYWTDQIAFQMAILSEPHTRRVPHEPH